MDTTQKNRESARQRPRQGEQKRSAPAERRPARAAENAPARQRSAQQQAPQTRQRPAQQQAPQTRQRPAQQQAAQPRQRTAPQQQDIPQNRSAQQRPAAKFSAPQGTGPRKSAPQRSAQERSAAAAKAKPLQTSQKRNPLQSFISGSRSEYAAEERMYQAQQRRQKRAAEAAKRKRQAQRYDTPAVIYTAPKTFNRNRFLVQLLTVVAIVIALIMGLSVFFKVETITISGAEKYDAWTVREASGIKEGDNLLTFSIPRASGQIMAELSYVDKVRIGIKLPDTVNIYIEELDVAYAIKDSNGTWWLMTSDGRMVEQTNSSVASKHTQVLGVTVDGPAKNEMAVATENVPTETNAEGELIPVTVTGAQRLNAALQILKALEANDIVGEAASVEVSRLEDIILWYGTRYQVNLGSIHDTRYDMEYKIACMKDTILQLSDYQTGILDISFTIFKDQVGYTPFQ